jgi:zinc transport system ATP-binding protein
MKHHENNGSTQCDQCTYGLCCTKIINFGVTRGRKEILKNINLHIHCGELTAVIGPNGAGKSTLLKAILGEISHSGELEFLAANNEGSERPSIGYVPQKLDFDSSSPTSVLDLFTAACSPIPVWLYRSRRIRQHVSESLIRVQAEHLIDRRLGVLSGGELQRVLLALALDPIPHLLLLDEPVTGLDLKGQKLFFQTVSALRKNYDLSIILVSHNLSLVAEYADRVVFIKNKTIECCGTPQEVFSNKNVMATFGIGLPIEMLKGRGREIEQ